MHSFFRADLYTLIGADRDLQINFGAGVVALCPVLPLSGKPVLALATHAHIDHVGGFHEFETRLGPAAEAEGFARMPDVVTLGHLFRQETAGPVVSRPPHSGFDIRDWSLTPAPLARTLCKGDMIDLGDRQLTCLHLPGHSPGSLGLLDPVDGSFFPGDTLYCGELVDDIPGASIPDYLQTMERLAILDCHRVYAGHSPVLSRTEMQAIARDYLGRKARA